MRSCWDKLSFCVLCVWIILPSWIPPKGSRKRQVMSPTMAPVPCKARYFLSTTAIAISSPSSCTGSSYWHCQCPNFTVTGSLQQSTLQGLSPFLPPLFYTHTPLLHCTIRFHFACSMHNATHHCYDRDYTRLSPLLVFYPPLFGRQPFPAARRGSTSTWQVGAKNPT